jgi:anti-anti-sigma factor
MQIPSLEEARTGQHVCQFYDTEDDLRGAVRDYVGSGLAAGDLVVLVTGSDPSSVRSYLRVGGVECDEALARGQVRIISLADMEVDHQDRDPVLATVVERLTMALRTRDSGGYAAARMASEVEVLYGVETVDQMVARERIGDELVASHPLLALCLYDRRLHDPDFLRRVDAVHEARVVPTAVAYRDSIVAIGRLGDGGGIRVFGELDISNRDAFADVVDDLVRDSHGDVVVDLANTAFIDLGALGVLATAAELHPDRRVVLVSPGPMVDEVLLLTGWHTLPNLVLDPAVPGGEGRP